MASRESGKAEMVQLKLTDVRYAKALCELLSRGGAREARCVELPDTHLEGVIVVDSDSLDLLPLPLPNPERVVLITRNDPEHLSRAWNAGVRSVVFSQDPLGTAVLAIMAAELRAPHADAHCPAVQAAGPRPASERGKRGN